MSRVKCIRYSFRSKLSNWLIWLIRKKTENMLTKIFIHVLWIDYVESMLSQCESPLLHWFSVNVDQNDTFYCAFQYYEMICVNVDEWYILFCSPMRWWDMICDTMGVMNVIVVSVLSLYVVALWTRVLSTMFWYDLPCRSQRRKPCQSESMKRSKKQVSFVAECWRCHLVAVHQTLRIHYQVHTQIVLYCPSIAFAKLT
jgi:hypothetical protein